MNLPFFRKEPRLTDKHKYYAAAAVGFLAAATILYVAPAIAVLAILLATLAAVAHDLSKKENSVIQRFAGQFS